MAASSSSAAGSPEPGNHLFLRPIYSTGTDYPIFLTPEQEKCRKIAQANIDKLTKQFESIVHLKPGFLPKMFEAEKDTKLTLFTLLQNATKGGNSKVFSDCLTYLEVDVRESIQLIRENTTDEKVRFTLNKVALLDALNKIGHNADAIQGALRARPFKLSDLKNLDLVDGTRGLRQLKVDPERFTRIEALVRNLFALTEGDISLSKETSKKAVVLSQLVDLDVGDMMKKDELEELVNCFETIYDLLLDTTDITPDAKDPTFLKAVIDQLHTHSPKFTSTHKRLLQVLVPPMDLRIIFETIITGHQLNTELLRLLQDQTLLLFEHLSIEEFETAISDKGWVERTRDNLHQQRVAGGSIAIHTAEGILHSLILKEKMS